MLNEIAGWNLKDWLGSLDSLLAIFVVLGGLLVSGVAWIWRTANRRPKYPAAGEYGLNVLASTFHQARVDTAYSLRVDLPPRGQLSFKLTSPVQPNPMGFGGWGMRMGTERNIGWETYVERDGVAIQTFKARPGEVDCRFSFSRPGDVTIEAFENGANTPTWTRTVHVD